MSRVASTGTRFGAGCVVHFDDLVRSARAAVAATDTDPAVHGLARLSGGMSHDVFTPVDDAGLVVKVFQPSAREAPDREWSALVALAGSGIAPEPVHFDASGRAVVVMTRVRGSVLSADALDGDHARMIGDIHRVVHRTEAGPRRPPADAGVRAARAALLAPEANEASPRRDDPPDVASRAWRSARSWMANVDIQRLLASGELRFCRGDPNLSNYLWSDQGVVLVDWENSGYHDPVLELADMAEHPSTRALGNDFWLTLADATELAQADRARLFVARRLLACFWIVVIRSRQREGLPTTVTLEEQARRTLAVLEGEE